MRVRNVDAAKTTAYWRRKPGLVKSTWVVSLPAPASLSMIQVAASAQPLAIEPSGSVTVCKGPVPGVEGPPLLQMSLAEPTSRSHSGLLAGAAGGVVPPGGVGEGEGAAKATRAVSRTQSV